jgi:hypothetical protein
MKAKSGGGITSNKLKNVKLNLGGPNKAIDPAWPAQVGGAYGNHAMQGDTPRTQAVGKFAGPALNPTPLGNTVAESTVKGPGGSRTIYQGQGRRSALTLSVKPMPTGRNTLAEFGPESKRR